MSDKNESQINSDNNTVKNDSTEAVEKNVP